MIIRDATKADAAACAAIYSPYVTEMSVSFEVEPPTPDQMAAHGAWHDVTWVQKTILDADDPPAEPR